MQGWCGGQQPTKAGRAAHSPGVQSTTAATDTSRAKGLGSWAAPNHEPGVVSVTHTHQSTGNGFHYRNVSKINFLKAFCSQNKLKWKKKKKIEKRNTVFQHGPRPRFNRNIYLKGERQRALSASSIKHATPEYMESSCTSGQKPGKTKQPAQMLYKKSV